MQLDRLKEIEHKTTFVSVEGIDGAGKSTQIPFIKSLFEEQGYTVITTREPGGTELAEKIRELVLNNEASPATQLLLMYAARTDHIEKLIKPSLDKGIVVITDRFDDCSTVYQGFASNLRAEANTLKKVFSPYTPTHTLFFDLDLNTSLERLKATGKVLDVMDSKDIQFRKAVHEGYHALVKHNSNRIYVIDCNKDIANVQEQLTIWFTEKFLSADTKIETDGSLPGTEFRGINKYRTFPYDSYYTVCEQLVQPSDNDSEVSYSKVAMFIKAETAVDYCRNRNAKIHFGTNKLEQD